MYYPDDDMKSKHYIYISYHIDDLTIKLKGFQCSIETKYLFYLN